MRTRVKTRSLEMGTVLVEGKTDEFLIGILLRELGINQPTLTGCGGKKEAVRDFENLVKGTGDFAGIIVDADNSAVNLWDSIRSRLLRSGLRFEDHGNSNDIPTNLQKKGLILNTRPRIGVWIMPNNEGEGEIEDFIIDLISSNDKIWRLADEYIEKVCIADSTIKKKSKAKLYSWLAACDPNRQPGAALDVKRLNRESENWKNFEGWAKRLFGQALD